MKGVIVSTGALKLNTMFTSKLLEVMFALKNFSNAKRNLIVQMDIPRCVINKNDAPAPYPFAKSSYKTTSGGMLR